MAHQDFEGAGHSLHESGAPVRRAEVHVVESEILEAAFRIDQHANVVARTNRRGGSPLAVTSRRPSP